MSKLSSCRRVSTCVLVLLVILFGSKTVPEVSSQPGCPPVLLSQETSAWPQGTTTANTVVNVYLDSSSTGWTVE